MKNSKIRNLLLVTIAVMATIFLAVIGVVVATRSKTDLHPNSLTWDGVSKVAPTGTGTDEDPFLIKTPANLAYLAQEMDYSDYYCYSLENDIDLNGHDWLPIGDNNNIFTGYFNGNFHKISGIGEDEKGYYSSAEKQAPSLFGAISNAEIYGVIVDYAYDSAVGTEAFGGIAKVTYGGTLIESCQNITDSLSFAECDSSMGYGGIIGYATDTFKIKSSLNKTNIRVGGDNAYLGGMVGVIGQYAPNGTQVHSTIEDCYNAGKLEDGNVARTTGVVIGDIVGLGYDEDETLSMATLSNNFSAYDSTTGEENNLSDWEMSDAWTIDESTGAPVLEEIKKSTVTAIYSYNKSWGLQSDGYYYRTLWKMELYLASSTGTSSATINIIRVDCTINQLKSQTQSSWTTTSSKSYTKGSIDSNKFGYDYNNLSAVWTDSTGTNIGSGTSITVSSNGTYTAEATFAAIMYMPSSYGGSSGMSVPVSNATATSDTTISGIAKTYSVTKSSTRITANSTGIVGTALSISVARYTSSGYKYGASSLEIYSGTSTSGTKITTKTRTAAYSTWSTSYTMSSSGTYYSSIYLRALFTKIGGVDYSVVYNANGGSGTMSNSSHVYGTAKNLTTNTFTRDGYQFVGWATSSTGSVVYTDGQSVSNLTTTQNGVVNLYAVWEEAVYDYVVTFDKQGGTGGSDSVGVNNGMTMPTIEIPTREGYTFGGYYSGTTGTTYYTATGTSARTYDLTTNTTLYASWTSKYYTVHWTHSLVVYDEPMAPEEGASGTYVSDMAFNVTSGIETGYTLTPKCLEFYDYTGDVKGELIYTSPINTTQETTLYAYFKMETNAGKYYEQIWLEPVFYETGINYQVSYDANGGSGSMANSSHVYGTASALRTNSFTAPTGKVFKGWATSSTGSAVYTDGQSVSTLTTTEGAVVTLYAVWGSNDSYIVTKNSAYANYITVNSTGTIGTALSISVTEYTNSNSQKMMPVTICVYGVSPSDGNVPIKYFFNKDSELPYAVSFTMTSTIYFNTIYIDVHYKLGYTITSTSEDFYYPDFGLVGVPVSYSNRSSSSVIATTVKIYGGTSTSGSLIATVSNGTDSTNNKPGTSNYSYLAGADAFGRFLMSTSDTYYSNIYLDRTATTTGNLRTFTVNNSEHIISPASTTTAYVSGYPLYVVAEGYIEDGKVYVPSSCVVYVTVLSSKKEITTLTSTIALSNLTTAYPYYYNGGNVPDAHLQQILYYNRSYISNYVGYDCFTIPSDILSSYTNLYIEVEWTQQTVATACRISYYPNGGTGSNSGTNVSSQHSSYAMKTNSFTRDGYEFVGWSRTPYGPVQYTAGQTVSVPTLLSGFPDIISLFAIWEKLPAYTLTFDKQSGSGGTDELTDLDTGATLPSITIPTREGYKFDGYYAGTNGTGAKYYDSTGTAVSTYDFESDATVYAKWIELYTITLNANGGTDLTGATTTFEVAIGDSLPTLSVLPTMDGMYFAGYFENNDGTGTQYYNDEGEALVAWSLENDLTIYAHWSMGTYTVTYDANGGTGSMDDSYHTFGEEKQLNRNKFVKAGYRFIGWSTSANGSVEYFNMEAVLDLTNTHKANVKLYAIWEVSSVGIEVDEQTVTWVEGNTEYVYTTTLVLKFTEQDNGSDGVDLSYSFELNMLLKSKPVNSDTEGCAVCGESELYTDDLCEMCWMDGYVKCPNCLEYYNEMEEMECPNCFGSDVEKYDYCYRCDDYGLYITGDDPNFGTEYYCDICNKNIYECGECGEISFANDKALLQNGKCHNGDCGYIESPVAWWECECGAINEGYATSCDTCSGDIILVDDPTIVVEWECADCGVTNTGRLKACSGCSNNPSNINTFSSLSPIHKPAVLASEDESEDGYTIIFNETKQLTWNSTSSYAFGSSEFADITIDRLNIYWANASGNKLADGLSYTATETGLYRFYYDYKITTELYDYEDADYDNITTVHEMNFHKTHNIDVENDGIAGDCEITFIAGNGLINGNASKIVTLQQGSEIPEYTITPPAEGYKFIGWSLDPQTSYDLDVLRDFVTMVPMETSVTLYAWFTSSKYTIHMPTGTETIYRYDVEAECYDEDDVSHADFIKSIKGSSYDTTPPVEVADYSDTIKINTNVFVYDDEGASFLYTSGVKTLYITSGDYYGEDGATLLATYTNVSSSASFCMESLGIYASDIYLSIEVGEVSSFAVFEQFVYEIDADYTGDVVVGRLFFDIPLSGSGSWECDGDEWEWEYLDDDVNFSLSEYSTNLNNSDDGVTHYGWVDLLLNNGVDSGVYSTEFEYYNAIIYFINGDENTDSFELDYYSDRIYITVKDSNTSITTSATSASKVWGYADWCPDCGEYVGQETDCSECGNEVDQEIYVATITATGGGNEWSYTLSNNDNFWIDHDFGNTGSLYFKGGVDVGTYTTTVTATGANGTSATTETITVTIKKLNITAKPTDDYWYSVNGTKYIDKFYDGTSNADLTKFKVNTHYCFENNNDLSDEEIYRYVSLTDAYYADADNTEFKESEVTGNTCIALVFSLNTGYDSKNINVSFIGDIGGRILQRNISDAQLIVEDGEGGWEIVTSNYKYEQGSGLEVAPWVDIDEDGEIDDFEIVENYTFELYDEDREYDSLADYITGQGAGTHSLWFFDADGNYTGEVTLSITVGALDLSSRLDDLTIKLSQYTYTYDGTAKKPAVVSVTIGDSTANIFAKYTDCPDCGYYTYDTELEECWYCNSFCPYCGEIEHFDVSYCESCNIMFNEECPDCGAFFGDDYVCWECGTYYCPECGDSTRFGTPCGACGYGDVITIPSTDYTVTYSNNINPGTATVTLTFKNNYSGTATTTFTINGRPAGENYEHEDYVSPNLRFEGTTAIWDVMTGAGGYEIELYDIELGEVVTRLTIDGGNTTSYDFGDMIENSIYEYRLKGIGAGAYTDSKEFQSYMINTIEITSDENGVINSRYTINNNEYSFNSDKIIGVMNADDEIKVTIEPKENYGVFSYSQDGEVNYNYSTIKGTKTIALTVNIVDYDGRYLHKFKVATAPIKEIKFVADSHINTENLLNGANDSETGEVRGFDYDSTNLTGYVFDVSGMYISLGGSTTISGDTGYVISRIYYGSDTNNILANPTHSVDVQVAVADCTNLTIKYATAKVIKEGNVEPPKDNEGEYIPPVDLWVPNPDNTEEEIPVYTVTYTNSSGHTIEVNGDNYHLEDDAIEVEVALHDRLSDEYFLAGFYANGKQYYYNSTSEIVLVGSRDKNTDTNYTKVTDSGYNYINFGDGIFKYTNSEDFANIVPIVFKKANLQGFTLNVAGHAILDHQESGLSYSLIGSETGDVQILNGTYTLTTSANAVITITGVTYTGKDGVYVFTVDDSVESLSITIA